tara:strand:- start:6292 stop:7479 length:1188 start_codon:yes stop_codon:yes gene_type:complete
MNKRKRKNRYKSKYQTGGSMYTDNTVQSAGQGGKGTTANIVFDESNPAVLQSKLQQLEETKNQAIESSTEMAHTIEQQAETDRQEVLQAEAESNQKFQTGENIAKQGMDTYKKSKDLMSELAASKAKNEAAARAAKSIAGKEFGNVARRESAEEVSKILSKEVAGKGTEIALSNTSGGSSSLMGAFSAPTPTPPIPGIVPPAPAVNAVTNAGTTAASEIGKTAVKEGASKFAGVGGTGAAGTSGLAKFATSGAGIGTIGALVGTGVSMLSDDGDPTKSNVGEYSGSILSSAGTGASVGSLLGPVGTAVGAGVGAIYGAAKQFFGTRKAKREQRKADKERMARVGKYNKEVSQNLASANMQARAGEIEQKTYSGYDLGRNVVAQLGGMRMGIPRYA